MPNVTMKAPATLIGGKVTSEYGNYGPIPSTQLLVVDQRLSAQLLNAGWQNVGLYPAGGTVGQTGKKVDAVDYNVSMQA